MLLKVEIVSKLVFFDISYTLRYQYIVIRDIDYIQSEYKYLHCKRE